MSYKFKILNNIFLNSMVEVYDTETPEVKTRIVVIGLKTPVGLDTFKLKEAIKNRLELTDIPEVEQEV